MKNLVMVAILTTSLVTHAMSEFEVKKQADGRYQITLNSDEVDDLSAAQKMVKAHAAELCQGQHVVLGPYDFKQNEVLNPEADAQSSSFELIQDLACAAEAEESHDSKTKTSAVFEPAAHWADQANLAFSTYTALLNEKKYKAAYQMMSDVNQQIVPYKKWRKNKKSFRKEAGGAGNFVDKKMTWYRDPPNASLPGIYVAFDYSCVYPELKHCSGVLIFHQDESGAFKVIREEVNMMDKKTAESMTEVDFEIKPHKTANISLEQWQRYHQLALLKYADHIMTLDDRCTTHVEAADIRANIYFTQTCHPAHPAWVTLYVTQSGQGLHLGQIGYFAGQEEPFKHMFSAYSAYREQLTRQMQQQFKD